MTEIIAELKSILPIVGMIVGGYLVLLWVASLVWTYRDISSRSNDILVQVLSTSMAFFLPFAGLLLYMLVRPRETLTQKYERELEETFMRRDIEDEHVCPNCQRSIQADFVLCPHCQTHLRRNCGNCERVIDLTWQVCPYCAAPANTRINSQPLRQPEYEQQYAR
ncbi:zinc ribbon domain-containing protein [Herpetosiphon llansteffanensis]|uniref:zinc ribbon domain-containing protein n=1 Tax=Herpetosiphon llansteffanensis TaxID=2094568 RepID=UPI000D7BD238|nr:zinc ribbon domain-containing protein [Herpetosiphon llansteffanensis]